MVSAVWGIDCKGVKQVNYIPNGWPSAEANAGAASQLLTRLQGEGRGEIQEEKGNKRKPWKNKINAKPEEARERRRKYSRKKIVLERSLGLAEQRKETEECGGINI